MTPNAKFSIHKKDFDFCFEDVFEFMKFIYGYIKIYRENFVELFGTFAVTPDRTFYDFFRKNKSKYFYKF